MTLAIKSLSVSVIKAANEGAPLFPLLGSKKKKKKKQKQMYVRVCTCAKNEEQDLRESRSSRLTHDKFVTAQH